MIKAQEILVNALLEQLVVLINTVQQLEPIEQEILRNEAVKFKKEHIIHQFLDLCQ